LPTKNPNYDPAKEWDGERSADRNAAPKKGEPGAKKGKKKQA